MSAIPLTPEEAIRAMLSGETLTSAGMECRWDRDRFVYYNTRPRRYYIGGNCSTLYEFRGLSRRSEEEDTHEPA